MGLLLYTLVLVTLLVLLWRISSVARCWIKYLVFGLVSVVSACGPIPIMLLRPRDSRNALIPAAGLRVCCKFLGITHRVQGLENIVKGAGCVVLINHQSMLDLIANRREEFVHVDLSDMCRSNYPPIVVQNCSGLPPISRFEVDARLQVLACLWPLMDNCTVISKKEIFYMQPFGLASWLWGTIFIDRVNAKGAKDAINKTGETIRDRKARVLMFPEGTRNRTKKLLPFKKGPFHLALASQCAIQPVVVSRYTFLGNQRFDNGHIDIKILPPISTKGRGIEELPKLMEEAYNIMSENVDLISNYNEERYKNNDKLKVN